MMRMRRKRNRGFFSPTVAATGWSESTLAEISWDKSRNAGMRWAAGGIVVGVLIALLTFAPAAWLAGWVYANTSQRLLLADARGTLWSGSATVVLTGGADSRDAASLPGRLTWTLRLHGASLELNLKHDCCLNGNVALQVRPGFRMAYTLVPPSGWVGQWPTAFLSGLGTPWNTMQLGGTARLMSQGLQIESARGRWTIEGRADLDLINVSSRLTTLDNLGSYRMSIAGDASEPGLSTITMTTLDGPLKISGTGTLGPLGLRFRGEARATADEEAALSNLLNIIGRRDGARSVISIG